MQTVALVLALLLAVTLSRSLARLTRCPLPLVQIGLGVLFALGPLPSVELEPEIFFLVLLPPLLFIDGWRIPKRDLFRDGRLIVALAIGLVIFTVVGMGYFIHWMIPAMPLAVAFALAAVLSPTDPVAVASVASSAPIPRRLMHILEGESLFNDASGLVCLRFAILAATTGSFSLSEAAASFVWLAVGGIAVGVLGTFAVTQLQRVLTAHIGEDGGTLTLLSLLIPFGVYLLAEAIGGSGILAVAAGGVAMSFVEAGGRAQALTRMRRTAVWDTVELAANGAIFVILGEQLPRIVQDATATIGADGSGALTLVLYVVAINLVLVLLRFLWVWATVHVVRIRLRFMKMEARTVSPQLVLATTLAGVKGTVTLAGILTLPVVLADGSPFPARNLAIVLAMSVILSTLLIATVLLPPILSHLRLEAEADDDERLAFEASGAAARQAIEAKHDLLLKDGGDAELLAEAAARALHRYERREGGAGTDDATVARARHIRRAARELQLAGLEAERRSLFTLLRRRQVDDGVVRRLVRQVDLLEARLRED
ncbi:Na+/H+ antiporter [Aureimonas endophytica]|uniref:Na+/H+ antiporter n=1 Tax=Aureimonas endophytica TaxID=2027858 RepID=A0A916ZDB0_9HYPH|nr:Na+/H+ antiporter [Aureimonas endophytica]GGD88229.1 Na+/H+ antiporter [Aureimonas endophytica]